MVRRKILKILRCNLKYSIKYKLRGCVKMSMFGNSDIVDLSEYMFFHNTIDEFIWLIKLAYSPAEHIKKRKYSVNVLFQYYIKNSLDFSKIVSNISSPKANNPDRFIYYLKQGWYNELAASYPYNSFQDNAGTNIALLEDSDLWQTELFPSWTITKVYYSVYDYYNALLFTHTLDCNTYKHRNSTNHFNNVLLPKFEKTLLKYPFNIVASDKDYSLKDFRLFDRKEWKHKYACYPRELNYKGRYSSVEIDMTVASSEESERIRGLLNKSLLSQDPSIYDVENQYYYNLKCVRLALKCKAPVNIVDLMYHFRTWANYTGSDTYIDLQKGGYLRYLQKNLYILNYFFGGLSELAAIAYLGEDKYVKVFNEFYKSFIETREEIVSKWYFLPLINRLRIYQHLNIINEFNINDLKPQNDTLELV